MQQISVVIITFNEEQNIKACIEAAKKVSNDIIVVDSYSTDQTTQIAQTLGAKIIQKEWLGYSEQKNYGNTFAKNDWILSLDADEVLSEELINNINQKLKNNQLQNFSFKRLSNYCGKWVKYSGWQNDVKFRIFNKNNTHWQGNVHEKLVDTSNAPVELLKGVCYHFTYKSIDQHVQKLNKYSSLAAEKLIGKKKFFLIFNSLIKPPIKFINVYILKKGFLDGSTGFIIAYLSAYYVALRYLKAIPKSKQINN